MKDLAPEAWDFLGDVAARWGIEEARWFRDQFQARTFTHLDGQPLLRDVDPGQLALPIDSEQLVFDLRGRAA